MTTSPTSGEDLLAILDRLDEMLVTARTMPMTTNALVNRDEALALLDRARQAVPSTVHRAEAVLADADATLAQGREEAERLLRRAHEEAERLVSAENVTRESTRRADEIVAAAEERAASLREGADRYSERSLATLEEEVTRIAEQIRSGREVLAARLGDGQPTQAPAQPAGQAAPQGPLHSSRRRAGWSVDPSQA